MRAKNGHPECDRLGIDEAEIQRRLARFALGPDVDARLERLRAAMEPSLDSIVTAFYVHLASIPELASLLADTERTARLRVTQRAYLADAGRDRHTLAYFESRLRIGRAHERVGLAPTHYIGAYARLLAIAGEHLAATLPLTELWALVPVLERVFWLDADLAMAAYHEQRHDALVASVRHDALTGVASRSFLMSRLAEECARAERFSRRFSVIFVDLDGFKVINDEEGHEAGDRILAAVGECLRRSVRPADVVGRYGGDEFVIGVVEGGEEEASEIARRVAAQLAQDLADEPRRPTASFGVAVRTRGEEAPALVHRADVAMYDAKRAGRNRIVVARD